MKRLTLLGATGSIGKSCLDVVNEFPEEFSLEFLSARSNIELLYHQAQKFHPRAAAITALPESAFKKWQEKFRKTGTELLLGDESLCQLAAEKVDVTVNAIVGAAGLPATLQAIQNGSTIALANKETLVIAGELVKHHLQKYNATLLPIDSEHSAIWQCLCGESQNQIRKIILTASGGPFRKKSSDDFSKITVEQALDHPNWDMGHKISIDSATMMNKGLEIIEAFWLFELPLKKIEVLVHPQSIIHSMVEFIDGSIKAQLGLPDMRLPIQYALSYPDRLPNNFPRLDFTTLKTLSFEPPDLEKFKCLQLAISALEQGGTVPAVLNAANEEAVYAFLDKQLKFDQIPEVIDDALQNHNNDRSITYESIIAADQWARQFVKKKLH